jgi:hypothetical protein
VGMSDFETNKETMLHDFDEFSQYMNEKTKNIFGIYFILIKQPNAVKSIKLKETEQYVVFALYCNDDFLDCGVTFMGDYDAEQQEVLTILKSVFK